MPADSLYRTQRLREFFLVIVAFFAIFLLPSLAFAFTCHRFERNGLIFEIPQIDPVSAEGQIYRAPLIVENKTDKSVSVSATFESIDSVFLCDESSTPVREIAPGERLLKTFEVAPDSVYKSEIAFLLRNPYLDAHYPIRASFTFLRDGREEIVELRPVFATKITERKSKTDARLPIAFGSKPYLKLNGNLTQEYRPYWRYDGGEYQLLPSRWSGSVDESGASLNPCSMTRGGVQRESWSTHPPFKNGIGVVGARFVVNLPSAKNLNLRFYAAMRDVFPPEPPTDGVEFRVYASSVQDAENGVASDEAIRNAVDAAPDKRELLFAEQYSGVEWNEYNVDLSQFSGQTILLTLESDPGAKRNTTCDNCFWGDVAILADPQEIQLANAEEREELRLTNLREFKRLVALNEDKTASIGVKLSNSTQGYELSDGQFAAVTLGKFGVCDGWITIGTLDRFLQIDGVRAQYQGVNIGFDRPFEPCAVSAEFIDGTELERAAQRFARACNDPLVGDPPRDLPADDGAPVEIINENSFKCFIGKTRGGLAFRFVASRNAEIGALFFGPFSNKADRVYFGQGHCIINPTKSFQLSGDGFACSTSHVGFDFDNGLSILEATTRPVDNFNVNPDLKIYTLTTCPDSRLTIRSSLNGAMSAAIEYADGYDKIASPLFAKKAGRFVFDYWGGKHSDVLKQMRILARYRLTDSILIQHVWQRYGYDVRLPDVWPPRPENGSLQDLKELQNFCDSVGVLFGLHDNYIDFYPDADDFTYDDIIINPDGQPQKAWYNPGPDAQSYRFNPTKIFPFVDRNLDLIRSELMQTAYFTDVFSSIHIMDFYDREGKYHSRAETLDAWNRYFDLARAKFNDNAVTVSESGSDALVGHLDGADGILRRITKTQENYSCYLECEDDAYVPWGDAVYHDKFSLHGVGYSDRYQGGLSRALRGIESDDYISSEALVGHAPMSDVATSVRGTVRKYWLLHDFARSLAQDRIESFDFVDNDVHHSKVAWKSGVVVYVNRGKSPWTLKDVCLPGTAKPIILPRFGFWTTSKDGSYGGVFEVEGQVVEMRVNGSERYYVNGRQSVANEVVPIRPSLENVKVVDGRELRAVLAVDAMRPTDKEYEPFLHIERPKTWWGDKTELTVLPISKARISSDKWQGLEKDLFGSTVSIVIPDEIEPGYYEILWGLFDPKTGYRVPLLGSTTSDRRCRLGTVTIVGRGENRTMTFKQTEPLYGEDLRLVPNESPSDFGVCQTCGSFLMERYSNRRATLTPLPNEPKFAVSLSDAFFSSGVFDVVAKNADGVETKRFSVSAVDGSTTLELDAQDAFCYEIVKR